MPEEANFLQLICLTKITPNTVLERFGSAINASIFDASNIAGTLKQNGLIDFTAYYPGPNEIMLTDAGKALLSEAEAKSAEPFDKLDEAVLAQLYGGKRVPIELQNTLNIRPRDLALRLYKLGKQGFIIYELKSGGIDILLTEAGFLKVSASLPVQKPAAQAPLPTSPQTPQPQQPGPARQGVSQSPLAAGAVRFHKPLRYQIKYVALVAAIAVAAALLYYVYFYTHML